MDEGDGWRERALTLLWQHTSDLVAVVGFDADGAVTVLDANPRELFPLGLVVQQASQLRTVLEAGTVVTDEVGHEVASGRRTYRYTLVPMVDPAGSVADRALAIVRDVTERRQAELALHDTQQLARIGHWSWDILHDVTTWSPGLFVVFGQDPEDFAPSIQGVLALLDDEGREALGQRVIDVLEGRGESFELEHDVRLPSGEVRRVLARGELIRDGDGAPLRLAGTSQDITEVRQAEAHRHALQEARRRQQQAVELNDDVIQGLSLAALSLELDDAEAATTAIDDTIQAVRRIVSELLGARGDGTPLASGDLVRSRPAGSAR